MIRSPRAFGASSFATHVMVRPSDGLWRTGRGRVYRRAGKSPVRIRVSREDYEARLSTEEDQ